MGIAEVGVECLNGINFLEDCKRVRSEKGEHVLRLLHNLVLNSTMRKNVDYSHGPPPGSRRRQEELGPARKWYS
jgi:hypothetical protein